MRRPERWVPLEGAARSGGGGINATDFRGVGAVADYHAAAGYDGAADRDYVSPEVMGFTPLPVLPGRLGRGAAATRDVLCNSACFARPLSAALAPDRERWCARCEAGARTLTPPRVTSFRVVALRPLLIRRACGRATVGVRPSCHALSRLRRRRLLRAVSFPFRPSRRRQLRGFGFDAHHAGLSPLLFLECCGYAALPMRCRCWRMMSPTSRLAVEEIIVTGRPSRPA